MDRKLAGLATFSALALLMLAAVAEDQPEITAAIALSARNFKFEIVDYERPLPGTNGVTVHTSPTSINDAGALVGNMPASDGISLDAFLYEHGRFTLLTGPLFHGSFTRAIAVNNRGEVLLVQDPQSTGPQARYFLYDVAQKSFRPIGPFIQVAGAPNKIKLQQINGFNDQGQFVGTFNIQGRAVGGFGTLVVGAPGSLDLPADAANFTIVTCPAGLGNTNALGMNNHAQITGSCGPSAGVTSGFIVNNGTLTLFAYPGASLTEGRSINNAGAVAGTYRLKSIRPGAWPGTGFVYDGAQFSPVALFKDPVSTSAARSINNKGQVAGEGGGSGFIAVPTPANPLRLSTPVR
jgi:uncharacterized membrane protein